jgi:hypothetical protein
VRLLRLFLASEAVRISDQSGPGAAGGGNGTGHMNLSGILAATADETTSGGGGGGGGVGSGLVAGDSMLSIVSSTFDSKDQRGSSPPPGARRSVDPVQITARCHICAHRSLGQGGRHDLLYR